MPTRPKWLRLGRVLGAAASLATIRGAARAFGVSAPTSATIRVAGPYVAIIVAGGGRLPRAPTAHEPAHR